jgi:hypothetical protein
MAALAEVEGFKLTQHWRSFGGGKAATLVVTFSMSMPARQSYLSSAPKSSFSAASSPTFLSAISPSGIR